MRAHFIIFLFCSGTLYAQPDTSDGKKIDFYLQTGVGFFNYGNDLQRLPFDANNSFTLNQLTDRQLNTWFAQRYCINVGASMVLHDKWRAGLQAGYGINVQPLTVWSGQKTDRSHLYTVSAYAGHSLFQWSCINLSAGGLLHYEDFDFDGHFQWHDMGDGEDVYFKLGYKKLHFNPFLSIAFSARDKRFYCEIRVPVGDIFYSNMNFSFDQTITENILQKTHHHESRNKNMLTTGSMFIPYTMIGFHYNLVMKKQPLPDR